jgi:hypothetical protein
MSKGETRETMTILSENIKTAKSIVAVLGQCRWEGVCYAKGIIALDQGRPANEAAQIAFEHGAPTKRKALEVIGRSLVESLPDLLPQRDKIGSAENPVTKLFPAAVTEQRFLARLEELSENRPGIEFIDDRTSSQYTLSDFTLKEGDSLLPINVKNAGTRFERAHSLVGLDPDDCLPIPAYKAHLAIDRLPNLIYVISVDYGLIGQLEQTLPTVFSTDEQIVWSILNDRKGSRVKSAEDEFVYSTVRNHWERINGQIADTEFRVISARKAVRLLQTLPHRTPGIGLKAWGTGASAEVNVHVSISQETVPWNTVKDRISAHGVDNIISAVNRKRVEEVYDPEI